MPGDDASCNNCGTMVCNAACSWNPCDIGTVDQFEENDVRQQAHVLPSITDDDDDAAGFFANINPSGDRDWFEVFVADTDFHIIEPWVALSQVPAGQTYRFCAWYVCNQPDGDPPSGGCFLVDGGQTATYAPDVSGCDDNCGLFCFDNGGTLEIGIEPITPGSCASYRVRYGG